VKHPFRWLIDSDGDRVKIDREIVPLIERLWNMVLNTSNSCQDNFGYVWVEFMSADAATAFLNIMVQRGDADLAYRAANPL
jgi:hypothetical protein